MEASTLQETACARQGALSQAARYECWLRIARFLVEPWAATRGVATFREAPYRAIRPQGDSRCLGL